VDRPLSFNSFLQSVTDGGFQAHLEKFFRFSAGAKFDQLAGWLPNIPAAFPINGYSDPEFNSGYGHVFVGMQDFSEIENSRTLAHEVAHNLGLRHTNFPLSCGDVDPFTDWPYRTCQAQENGVDQSGGLIPAENGDLMSYKRPSGISPFHVRKLLQHPLLRPAGATPKTESLRGRAATETNDQILISGWAQRDGSAGSLDPLYRIPADGTAAPSLDGGSHCLRFSAASGNLGDYCFTLSFQNVETTGLADRRYFTVVAPIPAGTSRVALITDGKELASLTAGSSTPSLTITSPQTGETWSGGERTITWSASDPDNRSMVFTVLYSSDGGESWLPMAIDSRQPQFTFDPKEIIGGNKVLFRVLATNGMNSTSADVGPIEVIQSPALEVAPSLEFAATATGDARVQAVKISNPGTGPLMIDSYGIDHPAFAMISAPAPSASEQVIHATFRYDGSPPPPENRPPH
jgi:hypothetical protein